MSEKIYRISAALSVLEAAGAKMSRQMFHQSLLEHLVKSGYAKKIGGIPGIKAGGTWEFDLVNLQHWGEYIAAVRERKEQGDLPGNYEFSESDMQCYIDGAWDRE